MGLALLTLLGTCGLFRYHLGQISRHEGWVNHTYEVLALVQSLRGDLLTAESTLRGHLLSGQPALRDGYQDALRALDDHAAQLARATHDNPAQEQRLQRLGPLMRSRLDLLAASEPLLASHATEEASQTLQRGAAAMTQALHLLDEMAETERSLLRARAVDTARSYFLAQVTGLSGLCAALLAVLVAYAFFLRDLHQREAAAAALRRARDEAESASQTKSLFLANMSHELRTPLNAVIGYSEMLREEAQELKQERLVPDLDKIHAAGKHLLALINDVLDLSKIEAGKMELYLETFPVAPMLREVLATVRPLADRNRDALTLALPPDDTLGSMKADLTKVRQVLFNLLSNACKFTRGGTVTLGATREGDRLRISVRDSGIGMDAAQRARLFQPFAQGDASTTRRFGGTGLGLALSRRFCQLMGGDISVESELGRGSTFTVELPSLVAAAVPLGDSSGPVPANQDAAPAEPQPLVLVIDDDPAARDLMRLALRREGFRAETAASGAEGLRLARALRPRAITLDVLMPGMDGWAVLGALKADEELRDIPVVMVTMVDDRNLGYTLGAADYLTKPIERERLAAVLRRYPCKHPPCRLLLIEDDEPTRHLMKTLLEQAGWRVTEAENGEVGLARLAEASEADRPELILLDLMMPEMDGFTFAARLRQDPAWRDIPVIVVTAKDLTLEDRQRLNGSVERILQKGEQDREALLREVRDLVRRCAC